MCVHWWAWLDMSKWLVYKIKIHTQWKSQSNKKDEKFTSWRVLLGRSFSSLDKNSHISVWIALSYVGPKSPGKTSCHTNSYMSNFFRFPSGWECFLQKDYFLSGKSIFNQIPMNRKRKTALQKNSNTRQRKLKQKLNFSTNIWTVMLDYTGETTATSNCWI